MEKHLFLKNESRENLYGCVFLPELASVDQPGIVICQPIAEEKTRVKRVMVNAARYLCSKGYPVILFDYLGDGDSGGRFEDATLKSRVSDALCAVSVLKSEANCGVCGFLGLRLGATIASLAALQYKQSAFLILWEPVIRGSDFISDWLKTHLSSQLVQYKKIVYNRNRLEEMLSTGQSLEVEGYIMSSIFYKQLKELNLLNIGFDISSPALIVEIASNKLGIKEEIYQFFTKYKANSDLSHYLLVNKNFDWANMKFYNPLPDNLFKLTFEWIRSLSVGKNN